MVFKVKYIILLLLALAAMGLVSCENDLAEVQRMVKSEEVAMERARDVVILYSDSAIVKVRVKAPTMVNYTEKKEKRREFPDGLLVEFLNDNKQVTSHLVAKFGVHLENDREVILRDSVVVWNIQNERLTTEELIWNENEQTIRSDKFVRVRTAKEEIFGRNFISNQDFTEWEIRNVEGFVEIDHIMEEN
ncbi:MAG: LPS export ABC transporter periplasmic protein LptC [Bacteroidota bacterium]